MTFSLESSSPVNSRMSDCGFYFVGFEGGLCCCFIYTLGFLVFAVMLPLFSV